VLTFALDQLLAQGAAISHVIAMHLAPTDPRIQHCLDILRREFEVHPAYRDHIRFDSVSIRERPNGVLSTLHAAMSGRAIERIEDFAAADAIWLTTHRLIAALKDAGQRIEMCVTGGPRLIGLQAVSAASLLFAPHDRCWHLFTPPDLRERAGEGAILHRGAGDPAVRLVPVPLLPMGMIAPNLRAAAAATPEDIIGDRTRVLSAQELRRCEEVLRQLTPRQRRVLREFARDGADVGGVADKLSVSKHTINSHKTPIFDACRAVWALPMGAAVSHHFLREKFGALPEEVWTKALVE
jgi:CRISPR-associated protein Csx14